MIQPLSRGQSVGDGVAKLVTVDAEANANSRVVALRLVALTLRLRTTWVQLFGDADSAAIALAIASIHADRLLREDLPPDLRNLSYPLPEHLYRRCNVASIAVATGLNRETTRRKIKKLEQDGVVVREGSEVRLAAGLTQQDDLINTVRTQLDNVRRTADELLRDGVILHQD